MKPVEYLRKGGRNLRLRKVHKLTSDKVHYVECDPRILGCRPQQTTTCWGFNQARRKEFFSSFREGGGPFPQAAREGGGGIPRHRSHRLARREGNAPPLDQGGQSPFFLPGGLLAAAEAKMNKGGLASPGLVSILIRSGF